VSSDRSASSADASGPADETGKVPVLVFNHQERRLLRPLPDTSFNTDDVEGHGITKTFRVTFDRNKYYVAARTMRRADREHRQIRSRGRECAT
jgi:hypothetical protein